MCLCVQLTSGSPHIARRWGWWQRRLRRRRWPPAAVLCRRDEQRSSPRPAWRPCGSANTHTFTLSLTHAHTYAHTLSNTVHKIWKRKVKVLESVPLLCKISLLCEWMTESESPLHFLLFSLCLTLVLLFCLSPHVCLLQVSLSYLPQCVIFCPLTVTQRLCRIICLRLGGTFHAKIHEHQVPHLSVAVNKVTVNAVAERLSFYTSL